jgi:hypothetical protein
VELRSSHHRPAEDLITDDRLPLADLLAKAGDSDFLCGVAEAVLYIAGHWLRWSPSVGHFDGLDKLGPGCRQTANFSTSFGP